MCGSVQGPHLSMHVLGLRSLVETHCLGLEAMRLAGCVLLEGAWHTLMALVGKVAGMSLHMSLHEE